jgi:hypothetical protein
MNLGASHLRNLNGPQPKLAPGAEIVHEPLVTPQPEAPDALSVENEETHVDGEGAITGCVLRGAGLQG